MSVVPISPPPEMDPSQRLMDMALRACDLAQRCAGMTADAISTGSGILFAQVRALEQELDEIDRAVDDEAVYSISQSTVREARELLACVKFVIDLERIGDLLASFTSRAQVVYEKLEKPDIEDLVRATTQLEQMLSDAGRAFKDRDLDRAIAVIRGDAEIDRLRNLIFMRHLDERFGNAGHEGIQVLFMAQAIERAGDHAKNLAEEVCHFVSGHTVRHLVREKDKSYEQMFLDWLRQKQSAR